MSLNSFNSLANWQDVSNVLTVVSDCRLQMPLRASSVCASINFPRLMSTSKLKCCMKSDHRIDIVVSAMVKFHVKGRRKPRSSVRRVVPYVVIVDPLAAKKLILLADI